MTRIVQVTITQKIEGQFIAECLDPPVTVEGRTLIEVKQNLMDELNEALKDKEPFVVKGKFYAEEFEN
jgi:hypothetical protein